MTMRDTYADDFDRPENRRKKKKHPRRRGMSAWVWVGLLVAIAATAFVVWQRLTPVP
jgi:type VI protein secretion system component VasF